MLRLDNLQVIFFFGILLIFAKPLGLYIASVFQGNAWGLRRMLAPIENQLYRFAGIDTKKEMDWKTYVSSFLIFNVMAIVIAYTLQRLQFFLPLNPQKFSGVAPSLAFNTAISFATNTDWQAYAGERSLSYLTQMLVMTVQNFLSAASGMAILIAFIRGLKRSQTALLGNFWVDMTRSVLYILMPLSIIFALFLISQGVIQNFKPYEKIQSYARPSINNDASDASKEITLLPMGPVASQVAIKQLGSNGGGFFNANAAHPFENPTPLSNFIEMLALLMIPMALCYTFGSMVENPKQGKTLLFPMLFFLIPLACIAIYAEQQPNPYLANLAVASSFQENYSPGGNLEGKETRFGIVGSSLWSTATTASSNGSLNASLDSAMPLSTLVCVWLMDLGEVIFGGVGTGVQGILILVIMTVFIAGLMVGRTPVYLGKKIEPFEMKMACVAILVMPFSVLVLTAIAISLCVGNTMVGNPGMHGLTEILYAFSSTVNNNGSVMSGLQTNNLFFNITTGIAMLIGRYWITIPMMAIAGSLAEKKKTPDNAGTLITYSPLFIGLLVAITIIFGALSFFPVLALGPLTEHLLLG